jgi:hypothetical protein
MRVDELTSYAWDVRLTLTCLQGIVNRAQPQLYLIHDHYDDLWLDWLRQRGDVDKIEQLEVGQVFARFLPAVSQMFVTDPAVPASINVATMLAAVHGGLVATPAIAGQFPLAMGAYPDSIKDGMDLRDMKWEKDIDAYRWAYKMLGGSLSRQAIAVLEPSEVSIRDYLVEFKIPILWMSGAEDKEKNPKASPKEEEDFAQATLMQWPPNIPCIGWPGSGNEPQEGIGESRGVDIISQCAKFEICSAYDGYSPTVTNASVHSGTTATLTQSTPPVRLQRDKVYFAFVRSDGDGPNFVRHYYRKLYDDSSHGNVPIGWQLGPTACDWFPDIVEYYYKKARPGDYFVNALSGVGYIHEDIYAENYPPEQREEIWREFIRLSSVYRARISTRVLSTFSEMAPERLKQLAGISGIDGIFANYGRTHATTISNVVTEIEGRPVFRAVNDHASPTFQNLTYTLPARRDTEAYMVNQIKQWTPPERPTFLHVFLANWVLHTEMAENIVKALGPGYVAVRPDQLVDLYQQARGRH